MNLLNQLKFVPIGVNSEKLKECTFEKAKKPSTITCMKTFKPEKNGLFYERIMGKDNELK